MLMEMIWIFFFFSSRRRHTRYWRDWSSDVCSSDLPGETLPQRLDWLQRVGLDGIELTGSCLDLPPRELEAIFIGSPVRAANVAGTTKLLHPDPKERAAAEDLLRRRLEIAGRLGTAGVLLVPQFGRSPELPDLSPLKSAVE